MLFKNFSDHSDLKIMKLNPVYSKGSCHADDNQLEAKAKLLDSIKPMCKSNMREKTF